VGLSYIGFLRKNCPSGVDKSSRDEQDFGGAATQAHQLGNSLHVHRT
jgi:hypothetical protein